MTNEQKRIRNIEKTLDTLAFWLVQAQTGFGIEDARAIADDLRRSREAHPFTGEADQDGAATKVYPANDWEHVTADCVACPGCAFTFDAFHVTQATGQYDCPVCGAQSRDGAA